MGKLLKHFLKSISLIAFAQAEKMHFIFFSAITVRADTFIHWERRRFVVTASFDCKTVAANSVISIYSVSTLLDIVPCAYSVLNVLIFLLPGECSCSIANSV